MNKMNVLGVFFLVLLSLGAVVVMADVNGLGSGDLVGFVNGAFSGALSAGSLSVSGSTSLGSVSGDDGVFSGDVNASNINADLSNVDYYISNKTVLQSSDWDYQDRMIIGDHILIDNYKDNSSGTFPADSTFIVGQRIQIYNYADYLKPNGISLYMRTNSSRNGADMIGFTADLGLLQNSNSTLKGYQAYLVDRVDSAATDMRAGYFRVEKNNPDSVSNNVVITSEGTEPLENGIQITGGGGFENGILLESNGDFDRAVKAVRKTTAGGNAYYTEGSWDNEIYLNRTGNVAKIRAPTILGLYADRSTSGGAMRFHTKDGSGNDKIRIEVKGGTNSYITQFGDGSAQSKITLTSPDASEWCLTINNTGGLETSSGACS